MFCPWVGCRLPGEVVEVGPTYALLSTYGIFTVLVENPGIEVHPGQHVTYSLVSDIRCAEKLPMIKG